MTMDVRAFLADKAAPAETVKVVISTRFKDENGKPIPFELRAITEEESAALRAASTVMTKSGTRGVLLPEVNYELYNKKVVAESVVYPDLKNAELQASYKVMGADNLLQRMLTAAEYNRLQLEINAMGGTYDNITDLVEEAKN